MAEYIDREAFKAEIRRLSTHYLNEWDTLGVLAAADRIPAADVREAKRGEWKRHHKKIDGVYSEWCVCSVCGQMATAGACYYDNETPFCPWCGAIMSDA